MATSVSEGATPGSPVNTEPTHHFHRPGVRAGNLSDLLRGRYYDYYNGCSISPDPFVPAPGDPQSLNRYTYVLNNPQTYTDPTGHFTWKGFGTFVASGIAGFGARRFVGGALGAGPALSGAIGGAAAGAVSAAMSGGNAGRGALLGAIGGFVGGGVAGNLGARTTQGIVGGALAGGIASGAAGAMIYGGDVLKSALTAGLNNLAIGTAQAFLMKGWEAARDWTDESAEKGRNAREHGLLRNSLNDKVTAGTRYCIGATCRATYFDMLPEHAETNRFFRVKYHYDSLPGRFINLISKVHDWMNGFSYRGTGNYYSMGPVWDTVFDAYSFTGMLPAAAITAVTFAPVGTYNAQ